MGLRRFAFSTSEQVSSASVGEMKMFPLREFLLFVREILTGTSICKIGLDASIFLLLSFADFFTAVVLRILSPYVRISNHVLVKGINGISFFLLLLFTVLYQPLLLAIQKLTPLPPKKENK